MPNGKDLLSIGQDRTVRVWDVKARKQLRAAPLPARARADGYALVSSDGSTLLIEGASGQPAALWDTATLKQRAVLEKDKSLFKGVMFSPDGRLLATVSYITGIHFWDTRNGKRLGRLKRHDERHTGYAMSAVSDATFSPDGKTLATAGGVYKTAKLWDIVIGTWPPAPKGKEGK